MNEIKVSREDLANPGDARHHISVGADAIALQQVAGALLQNETQKEASQIQQAQQEARGKGILAEAITFAPTARATGHVAHIMPKNHNPTSMFSVDGASAIIQAVLAAKKHLLMYWHLLKTYEIRLPMFEEMLHKDARAQEALPRKKYNLRVNNIDGTSKRVDVCSAEGQRLLFRDSTTLESVLEQLTKASPRNLIAEVAFHQPHRPETFARKQQVSDRYSRAEFTALDALVQWDEVSGGTLGDVSAERVLALAREYEELLQAMNDDFVAALLAAGNQHVQQLVCGPIHVKHVVRELQNQGSTVLVSAIPGCENWRDMFLPTQRPGYAKFSSMP